MLEGIYTREEFWDHYSVYAGCVVTQDKRENFFSCSC